MILWVCYKWLDYTFKTDDYDMHIMYVQNY